MRAFVSSLAEAVRAFRAVFGNPDLRRVELAFVGFNAAEMATWIAILVFAFEAGGAAAAGAIGVIQLIPAIIFAPPWPPCSVTATGASACSWPGI